MHAILHTTDNSSPPILTTEINKQNEAIVEKMLNSILKILRDIAVATKKKDQAKVNSLTRVLIGSRGAQIITILSALDAKGAATPGVDGVVVTSMEQVVEMLARLGRVARSPASYKASPVREVMVPKPNSSELRPIGISTFFDRCVQILYAWPLKVIAEQTADRNSFGFRQGRSTHDAIFALSEFLRKLPQPGIILDADISKFFNSVSHEWLLNHIPMDKNILTSILNAGKMSGGNFVASSVGFPQGGVISPVLANMALDGLEQAIMNAVKKYDKYAALVRFVRYADDFVVTGPNQKWVFDNYIIPAINAFLAERGLSLSKTKTTLVTREQGVDFLGYNVQYVASNKTGGKNWFRITPSKKALNRFKEKVDSILAGLNGLKYTEDAIEQLNSFLKGWGQYYRYGHTSMAQSQMDMYVWESYRSWIKKWLPESGVSDRDFRNRVYIKVGSIASVPFYRKSEDEVVTLFRLSSIKTEMNYSPRRPLIEDILGGRKFIFK